MPHFHDLEDIRLTHNLCGQNLRRIGWQPRKCSFALLALDQPFGLKCLQGPADGSAAHTHTIGQLLLCGQRSTLAHVGIVYHRPQPCPHRRIGNSRPLSPPHVTRLPRACPLPPCASHQPTIVLEAKTTCTHFKKGLIGLTCRNFTTYMRRHLQSTTRSPHPASA